MGGKAGGIYASNSATLWGAFGVVHGADVSGRITLNQDESFAFQFGTILDDAPPNLEERGFVELSAFQVVVMQCLSALAV